MLRYTIYSQACQHIQTARVNRFSWVDKQRICRWEIQQDPPELSAGELHLWWMPLSAAAGVTDRLSSLLSKSELARAARFRFDRHRVAYILGRGSLRRFLAGYTGVPAGELAFRVGPHGKPALAHGVDGRRLCFNYSDAGGYALYGFTWDAEIGVDLENLDREISYEEIARRKFSRAESEAIFSLPDKMRKTAFLACWTRKEGYGKAEGLGIHYSLESVELCVDCEADRVTLVTGDGEPKNWTLRQIYPNRKFVGCIVYPTSLDAGGELVFRYFKTCPDRAPG